MEACLVFRIIFSIALIGVVGFLIHEYNRVWVKCKKVRRKLRIQGIKGPEPCFLYGNLHEMQNIQLQAKKTITPSHSGIVAHDYTSNLFPYFEHWRKLYGPVYTYSTGNKQHMYVNKVELVKELNKCINLDLGKPSYLTRRLAPLLGNGVVRSNGLVWSHHRKIIAPEFLMDKVKGMVGVMLDSAVPLLEKWEKCIEDEDGLIADIQVDEDLRAFSADIISRTCFGSSYFKGKLIFSKLRTLQKLISHKSFLFGFSTSRYLPLRKQKEIKRLEREIDSLIWDAVQERERELLSSKTSDSLPLKDLMQSIMEAAMNDENFITKDSSKRFIVDNCKSIYFAGHESTAVAASWCLMLLALHPEWQTRIRNEVAQVCPHGLPDASSLSALKTVTMVIQEALRLYPPAALVSREALEETQIGNITVPKGVCLWTLIPTLHRDPDIWGKDANEFKPERFAVGISKACKAAAAYIPFGVGGRLCLGRNFAMVELKIVISLIVSRFSFSLSPKYRHCPSYRMIVEPGHGVNILIRKV